MNILPQLNQFIEDIKEFHPETDIEQEGKKILTFNDTFDNLRKVRTEIQQIKDKYPIDKYVTIKYCGPVTVKVKKNYNLYVLYFDENLDTQIIDNVTNDLLAIEEIMHIIPARNAIFINLKESSFDSPYKFREILKAVNIAMQKHNPGGASISIGKLDYPTTTEYQELVVEINLTELHKDRLQYFYHRDMTQADEAESIKYLINLGLSESDIGISRSKYFRYKEKPQVAT